MAFSFFFRDQHVLERAVAHCLSAMADAGDSGGVAPLFERAIPDGQLFRKVESGLCAS